MLRARKLASAALTAGLIAAGGVGTTVLSAGAALAATCPTASQTATSLNALTAQTGNLNNRLSPLSTNSSASDVNVAARATVDALNTLTNDYAAQASALNGCSAYGASDSQRVSSAYTGLINVTQATLATLIGKHSIFAQFQQTAPIAAVQRNLEASFDSDSLALLNVAPSESDSISSGYNAGTNSLNDSINTYNQVCIPSPLYPIILPVCVAN
jgi:hypothetical protein